MKCDIGDIVAITNFNHPDNGPGSLHFFVVMDVDQDEYTLVDLIYYCFLISSQTEKNNIVNLNYPYNEPINPTDYNGLLKPSHVKCDHFYEINNKDDIIQKLGRVTEAEYTRFVELYTQSLEE
ncbi:MAG: hypothetical protein FWD38_10940 [Oscillospiraceae bacterium]|nr:hypothetical protein [Oscillospiraceae bacterium]